MENKWVNMESEEDDVIGLKVSVEMNFIGSDSYYCFLADHGRPSLLWTYQIGVYFETAIKFYIFQQQRVHWKDDWFTFAYEAFHPQPRCSQGPQSPKSISERHQPPTRPLQSQDVSKGFLKPLWLILNSCPSLCWSSRRDRWGSHSPEYDDDDNWTG